MNRFLFLRLLLLAAFSASASPAWAHKASDAFIYLDLDQSTVRVDLALRDLAWRCHSTATPTGKSVVPN